MSISKLASLCKISIFVLCLAMSFETHAGYYIQYMRDPCVEYEACDATQQHHVTYKRPHYRHHYTHRRPSSYSISVNYYWNMYPVYSCADKCRCSYCHSCNSCGDDTNGSPVEYRESDYHSSYYSAYNDVDYDTSTADDMTRRSENY